MLHGKQGTLSGVQGKKIKVDCLTSCAKNTNELGQGKEQNLNMWTVSRWFNIPFEPGLWLGVMLLLRGALPFEVCAPAQLGGQAGHEVMPNRPLRSCCVHQARVHE